MAKVATTILADFLYYNRRDVLNILPDLNILDGELLEETLASRRTSKSSKSSLKSKSDDGSASTICTPRFNF